jgi:peptidoglycan/xylan/chitin deacetylase (PgdA/CDA1 family)
MKLFKALFAIVALLTLVAIPLGIFFGQVYSISHINLSPKSSPVSQESSNVARYDEILPPTSFSSSVVPSSTSSSSIPNKEALNKPNTQSLQLPVLMYHHIADLGGVAKNDNIEIGLRVSPTVFDKQMEHLSQKGYHTISSEELYNYQFFGTPLPSNPIIITLDDGFMDNYINAYPILKKYGFKGEFAIITNLIGQGNYMTWDILREMKAGGMVFSSHTLFHCYLASVNDAETKKAGHRIYLPTPKRDKDETIGCPHVNNASILSYNQVTQELQASKDVLEKELGVKIFSIVYPFGNYNNQTQEIAKKAGYSYGFTTEGQYAGNLNFDSPYKLPRTRVFGQQELPLRDFFGGK